MVKNDFKNPKQHLKLMNCMKKKKQEQKTIRSRWSLCHTMRLKLMLMME